MTDNLSFKQKKEAGGEGREKMSVWGMCQGVLCAQASKQIVPDNTAA